MDINVSSGIAYHINSAGNQFYNDKQFRCNLTDIEIDLMLIRFSEKGLRPTLIITSCDKSAGELPVRTGNTRADTMSACHNKTGGFKNVALTPFKKQNILLLEY